jgi:hypothetical protein
MTDGHEAERGERAKVVYCGGCNPHIDRSALAAGLPLVHPGAGPEATVHLSGCPRACASDHQLAAPREAARGTSGPVTIVVAGELVDGVPTPEAQLAPTITRKLKE